MSASENSMSAQPMVLICQAQTASATLPRGALTFLGGFHVGRGFAAKAVWLVGGGSDCRHGARASRVRASRGTDDRHGASAITTARTAHGSANAAPRSSCLAGLPARRSSRRDVIAFHQRGRLSGRPRHSVAAHALPVATTAPASKGRDAPEARLSDFRAQPQAQVFENSGRWVPRTRV